MEPQGSRAREVRGSWELGLGHTGSCSQQLRPAASGEQGADHPTLVTPELSPFLAETLAPWRPPQGTAVLFNLFLTVSLM